MELLFNPENQFRKRRLFMLNIFNKQTAASGPEIQFGRFSSSYKTPDRIKYWDDALEFYNQKKYIDSYVAFINYLEEAGVNNIRFSKTGERVDFEILQGSKKVTGTADAEKLVALVNVAGYTKLSVAYLRRLLDMNYTLSYSRFCLKDNVICMKFDTAARDGSPWKLYYGLKEMATRADRIDDLLIDEFSALQAIDNRHVIDIPAPEKEVKYEYLQKWTREVLERVKGLNADKFSGGISYLLLDLAYRLDYLIKPEGRLLDILGGIQRVYFAKDEMSYLERNRLIGAEFEKIIPKPKETVFKELYRVTSTFSVVNPTPHDEVASTIENEMKNLPWYKENKYPDIAMSIVNYIVGYCLFNFGLNRQTRQLFHLLYQITCPEYFAALTIRPSFYDPAAQKLNKSEIRDAVGRIMKTGADQFPNLMFDDGKLNFEDRLEFCESYLHEIKNLNYNP
jgi:hypothetical protein